MYLVHTEDNYEIVSAEGKPVRFIMRQVVGCEDCGRPYGDEHGFPDFIVDDDVWERLMPGRNGGGLLCPCCMSRRAYELNIVCRGVFTSGPFSKRSG